MLDPSNRETEARLQRVFEHIGHDATSAARALIVRYLAELRRWNRKLDLTAAKSEDELCDLFVADAAKLASLVGEGKTVCDVGTGAGAPGLVLALLRPDLSITLVEPLAKRTSFMRSFWAEHAERHAPRVRIQREAVAAVLGRGERYALAMSRATFEPAVWLERAKDLLEEPGGEVAVLLAKEPVPPAPAGLELVAEYNYSWPLTTRERTIALFRRGAAG